MQSRLEKVKRSFQYMDLPALRNLLSHEDSLFETSPKIFFEIIGDLFNQLRDRGETYLYLLQGIGINESDYKCPAYRFIGNNFKNYFDFSISPLGNNNLRFEKVKNVEIALGERFTITINDHKKLPDYQSDELKNEYDKGYIAFQELEKLKEGVSNLSEYVNWIEKYTPLFIKNIDYEEISNSVFTFFHSSFLKLRKLKNLNQQIFQFVAQQAYSDYQNLNKHSSIEVLAWLGRYEKAKLWFIPYYDNNVESNLEKGYFNFDGYKIYLKGQDEMLKFIHYYNFHARNFSKQFSDIALEYDDCFTDYYSTGSMGFYERNLKRLGIRVETVKIKAEEDPIEIYFLNKAKNQ